MRRRICEKAAYQEEGSVCENKCVDRRGRPRRSSRRRLRHKEKMTHWISKEDLPSDDLISIVFAVRRHGSKLAGKARDLQAGVIATGFAKLVAPRLRSIDDAQRGSQIHRCTTLTETREPGSLLILPRKVEEERIQTDVQIAVTEAHAFEESREDLLPPRACM
jgi:hypothetical protein